MLELAQEAVRLAATLPAARRARLQDRIAEALTGDGTLVPLFHLLRVAARDGASIAAEVWALPDDGFGRFVAAIPPPLCIGTLLLNDGSMPKGFLAEPEGLVGAEDITRYGGWRCYLAAIADPTPV